MSFRTIILLFPGSLLPRAAAVEWPVLTARDALKLTSDEAKKQQQPALLTGVVMMQEPKDGWMYLHDGTAGILVVPPTARKVPPGTKITVTGRLSGGAFAPFVRASLVAEAGSGEFPAPVRTTAAAVARNEHFGQWVEIEGGLRDAVDFGNGATLLTVSQPNTPGNTAAGTATVICYHSAGLINPAHKDATVRVRGVNWTNAGISLYMPSPDHFEVVSPGREDVFASPEFTAAQLIAAPPAQRVRLRATTAALMTGLPVVYLSGTTGLMAHNTITFNVGRHLVPVASQRIPEPGEEVELTGFASVHAGHLVLKDCEYRTLAQSAPPPAAAASLADIAAGRMNARLVSVEGRLASIRSYTRGTAVWAALTIEEAGTLVEASVAFPEGQKLMDLPRDYITSLTGVVVPPADDSLTPRLLVRRAEDVQSKSLAFPAATRRALEIGGIVLAAALGLLGWIIALRRKVKSQRSEQQALRESEEKFRLLFDRSGDAILLLDGGLFQFTDCNEATVRMLRANSKEEVCRTHPALLSPEFQPDGRSSYEKADEMMATVVREGSHRFEWMHRRMDGEDFLVEVLLTTVQFGEQPLIVTVWREIGERKRAEAKILELNATLEQRVADRTAELARTGEELRKALEAERDLSRLKSNFVSMVSHEFRTPLGIISVSSELLTRYRDRLKPEQRDEHLTAITSATKRMAGMMENILVLSRVDTNRLECNPAPLDLPGLCRRLVDEMHSITSQSCPIQLTVGPGTDAEARADESILRHILPNLLSNACKYSPAGSTVQFSLTRDGSDAIFTITDKGIGIPESDQEKLFQSFHRGANVGQTPGTGLGLVIVKRCTDLHGGTISVMSAPREGSTFTVRLPVWGWGVDG